MKKMMFNIWKCLLLVCLLATSGCANIGMAVYEKPAQYADYLFDEGPFVSTPMFVGWIAGTPLALVTAPFAFAIMDSGGEGSGMMAFMVSTTGPIIIGDVVATPFLAAKRTVWDFPKWVFTKQNRENGSSNKVDATSERASNAASAPHQD